MTPTTPWHNCRTPTDDVSAERLNLYKAFKAVTGLGDPIQPKNKEKRVKGLLAQVFGDGPKQGVFQSKLLGMTVDLVGRSVVIPDPNLSMDQAALPEENAWDLYSPFVVRRLVRNGMSRLQALQFVKDRHRDSEELPAGGDGCATGDN